jgi:predicted aldo/keto reductase-like oxidoreductase
MGRQSSVVCQDCETASPTHVSIRLALQRELPSEHVAVGELSR